MNNRKNKRKRESIMYKIFFKTTFRIVVIFLPLLGFLLFNLFTCLKVGIIYYSFLENEKDSIISMASDYHYQLISYTQSPEISEDSTDSPNLSSISAVREPIRIYDINNELIAEVEFTSRKYANLDQVSENAIKSIIAVEDSEFYSHKGVSFKDMLRAVYYNFANMEVIQGASTITQQLAKELFTDGSKTLDRKLFEIFCAIELEKHFSKEEILFMYINIIPFSNNTVGIADASEVFFDKDPLDLDIVESALLAGVLASPEGKFSPYTNPYSSKARHLRVINLIASKYPQLFSFENLVASNNSSTNLSVLSASLSNTVYDDTTAVVNDADSIDTENNESIDEFYLADLSPDLSLDERLAAIHNRFWQTHEFLSNENEKQQIIYNVNNAPYVTEYVMREINKRFIDSPQKVLEGGLDIYTSIDIRMQNAARDSVRSQVSSLRRGWRWRGETFSNGIEGSLISIDPATGQIKALIGGYEYSDQNQLIRPVQSYRQPGSAFKPVVYLAALDYTEPSNPDNTNVADNSDNDQIHKYTAYTIYNAPEKSLVTIEDDLYLDTLREDILYNENNLQVELASSFMPERYEPFVIEQDVDDYWMVHNYGEQGYGLIPLTKALAVSSNVVAAKLLEDIGVKSVRDILQQSLFMEREEAINRYKDYQLSLSLGTIEMTSLELCQFYSMVANKGNSVKPYLIRHIIDRNRNIIWDYETARDNDVTSVQAASPEAAFILTSMLRQVVAPGGTAARLVWQYGINYPCAGKTGTTQNYRDFWFAGYTPELVTVVWVGHDEDEHLYGSGGSTAAPIFGKYMHEINDIVEKTDFEFDESLNLVKVPVCSITGLLPVRSLNQQIDYNAYFFPETRPNRYVTASILSRYAASRPKPDDDEEEEEEETVQQPPDRTRNDLLFALDRHMFIARNHEDHRENYANSILPSRQSNNQPQIAQNTAQQQNPVEATHSERQALNQQIQDRYNEMEVRTNYLGQAVPQPAGSSQDSYNRSLPVEPANSRLQAQVTQENKPPPAPVTLPVRSTPNRSTSNQEQSSGPEPFGEYVSTRDLIMEQLHDNYGNQ